MMQQTYNTHSTIEQPTSRTHFGITGSTLKIIALFSMLIDHIGALVLRPYTDSVLETAGYVAVRQQTEIYELLRTLGRFAFPIFCFLLVEGFLHTHNVWLYAARLFLFALISEIPFNLAFRDKLFSADYQNVFIELFIGLLVLIVLRKVEQLKLNPFLKLFLAFLSVTSAMFLAYFVKTDYNYKGILAIVILYLFNVGRKTQAIAGAAAFAWELPAPLAFIPIYFYNGKRGWKMKYFFYIFYPLHLFILYLIRLHIIN